MDTNPYESPRADGTPPSRPGLSTDNPSRRLLLRLAIILLGIFLWACFIPAYGVFISMATVFVFGDNRPLFWFDIAASYLLAAVSAVWIVRQLWAQQNSQQRR
jgi:hypothetical protein